MYKLPLAHLDPCQKITYYLLKFLWFLDVTHMRALLEDD